MTSKAVEILCSACGADTLLKREPRYDGFKKVGERLLCAACGHEFANLEAVPFKERKTARLFTDADRLPKVDVFEADEKGRNCRHCQYYLVNPFTQRCGRHFHVVQATDVCDAFERKEEAKPSDGGDGRQPPRREDTKDHEEKA